MKRITQALHLATLVALVSACAACSTAPTNTVDAKKAAQAERIADRLDTRPGHGN